MKSFLEGRPSIARHQLPADRPGSRLPSFSPRSAESLAPALAGHAGSPARAHGEKKIETEEVDGVVQKIIVTCGCGERIEIHCGY